MRNSIVKNKIIKDENGYRFFVYPTNSNTQHIGYSIHYNTYQECCDGLKNFKNFIENNNITSHSSQYVKIEKQDKKYICKFYNENNQLVFLHEFKEYEKKEGCKKGIESICTNMRKELIFDSLK